MVLNQTHAEKIAKKLSAASGDNTRHGFVEIEYNGKVLFSYGIRRASKAKGHDYIPKQIKVSMRQARNLANCPMSKKAYFEHLRSEGYIEDEDTTPQKKG